jgi:GrpB-like predicted nucleotidyltransferase (UPF0157 family)
MMPEPDTHEAESAHPESDAQAPALGLAKGEVRVVNYDDRWALLFDREKRELDTLFREHKLHVRIEHVGSTAVDGLAAKPVIDIALGILPQQAVGPVMKAMLASGRIYIKGGNQPGMLFLAKGDPREFFYHLVVLYTPAWERLILVRTHLRRHRGIANEYAELKLKLAKDHPKSRLNYTNGKDNYVRAVLNRAYHEFRRTAVATAVQRSKAALSDYLNLVTYNQGASGNALVALPLNRAGYPASEHLEDLSLLTGDLNALEGTTDYTESLAPAKQESEASAPAGERLARPAT